MTVKTTLSFTDRHHQFLADKVGSGVFASTSAAVAAAVEQLIQDDAARAHALDAMGDEIRARMQTPQAAFEDDIDAVFAPAKQAATAE